MRFIIPENAVSHFHLREGDAVGDFGAGTGYFEKALTKAVGASGTVYAIEIQKQVAETLRATAQREHWDNVTVCHCDLEMPGTCDVPDGVLDAGFVANALFQFEDKEAALREIARMTRIGGKFFLLEWSESFGNMGPRPDDVISEERAKELISARGFRYERSFPAGEHHYGLAFRRI